jgi:hypothetical protein
MSQNRSGIQADQRNHLDLQINLLAEHENTKMLQMLRALCAVHKLPIADDPEIAGVGEANGGQGSAFGPQGEPSRSGE